MRKKISIDRNKARFLTPAFHRLTAFSITALLLLQQFLIISPASASAAIVPPAAPAIIVGSLTELGTPVTENFDTLAASGTGLAWTDNTTIPGWYSSRPTYNAGDGASNTGALYSFGTTGSGDRALGSVGSGSTGTVYSAVRLVNDTGATITSLDISFIGEQWRSGGSSSTTTPSIAQTVDFQYRVADAGVVTGANAPSTGWSDYDALDFTSPVFGTTAASALNGNLPANRVSLSSTLPVTVGPGQEIWLRWRDVDHPNTDHGLAIDDFSVTPSGTLSTSPTGTGAASPDTVQAGGSSLLTVAVTPGTNPDSTGLSVTGDLGPIGGSALQQFYDDGTNGDLAPNDNVFSFGATVAGGTSGGGKSLNVTITDGQARTGSTSISLTVQTPVPGTGAVAISQIYGGGGNAGATYRNDFIEIFNRGSEPVNLAGWSVQYASSTGTSWQVTPLTNFVLQPGQYYLVQQAAGTGGSEDLPAPDAAGGIAMAAGSGKIALVGGAAALSGACPSGGSVIDFVGYGTGANCSEGAPTPNLTNTTAAIRVRSGCKDTDANNLNFTVAAPVPRNSSNAPNVCPLGDYPPEVFSTDPANGASNIGLSSNLTVRFDDNVAIQNGAFNIACAASGSHSYALTGGPSDYVVNPDTDFLAGEICTVTVLASHVASLTTGVPMAADYSWSFGTLIVRDPAEHMVMGNPSGAAPDITSPLNYLMMKPQYALSYNNEKGIPNWTSWHLDSTWTTGAAQRQDDFRPDMTLPDGFKRVSNGYNFATYGFDRGHMVPSADRTSSIPDNSATFLMTNMIPQASGNNQGPWAALENDTRALLGGASNELYIVSGGYGIGGVSSTGSWDNILDTAGNTVTVPNLTWKVIMVLPRAEGDDVLRVTAATRTFAVIMPNRDDIRSDNWRKYLATVDQVEALTGYDFFSNVPVAVQAVIEARLDDEYNTAPVAVSQSVTTPEDTPKEITLTATDFNVNNQLTYTVVGAPAHGTLSGSGNQLTYVPYADYNGSDSFTFKVGDGGKESGLATVSINVTAVNDAPVLAPIGNKTVYLGETLTFTASGTDADLPAQTLSFSLTGMVPTGASIDAVTGEFSWTPSAAQAGQVYIFGVRVTDNGPGQLYAEETIGVGAAYTWSGFLQPINPNGTSVFRRRQTIPVRFQLTGASAGITDAVVRLFVSKVSNQVVGTELEAGSTSAATEGNLFRYENGEYVFNLGTSALTPGTYRLRVDSGDGVERAVLISIK